jgi:shikimate dehydrogenase
VNQRWSAAVIGSPILHSLSPHIFSLIAERENGALDYTAQEITAETLPAFLKSLRENKSFIGANVTLPLKELVIPALDEVSESARAIGAVNVIHHHQGKLIGLNTDLIGIERTFNSHDFSVTGKTCLVWGAGGSAKAVAYVLGKYGAEQVVIYNPRSDRGESLAQKFNSLFPKTKFRSVANLAQITNLNFSLLVNATPVGMGTDQDEFFREMTSVSFQDDALAFDLIYTPERTSFLKTASSVGMNTVGGLRMLIEQAIATWEIWSGARLKNKDAVYLELHLLLKGILRLRQNPAPVFLTGFMGVGKSAVAAEISKITQRNFVDTDQVIQKTANKTIAEIFKNQGEQEFRNLEKKAVHEASRALNTVVALGGGALLNRESLDTIRAHGKLIYLMADEQTLVERIEKQGMIRPLLAGLPNLEKQARIKELLALRAPIYEQAHLKISTLNQNAHQVARNVISHIGGQIE